MKEVRSCLGSVSRALSLLPCDPQQFCSRWLAFLLIADSFRYLVALHKQAEHYFDSQTDQKGEPKTQLAQTKEAGW